MSKKNNLKTRKNAFLARVQNEIKKGNLKNKKRLIKVNREEEMVVENKDGSSTTNSSNGSSSAPVPVKEALVKQSSSTASNNEMDIIEANKKSGSNQFKIDGTKSSKHKKFSELSRKAQNRLLNEQKRLRLKGIKAKLAIE